MTPLPLAKGEADIIAVVIWIAFMAIAAISGVIKRARTARQKAEAELRGPAARPIEEIVRGDDAVFETEAVEDFGQVSSPFARSEAEPPPPPRRSFAYRAVPHVVAVAPPPEFATAEAHAHPELCASFAPLPEMVAAEESRAPGQVLPAEIASRLPEAPRLVIASEIFKRRGAPAAARRA